jgi:heme oxygenase
MFHDELVARTGAERDGLIALSLIQDALRGQVTRAQYLEFLAQAYHHVRHTVPLLMACGLRLPERLAWLRAGIVRYIEEEAGHDEWILDDIRNTGGDAEGVRRGDPSHATEVMVAYAYDGILRRNALNFFGMAFVLEGTSVQLATRAAGTIRQALNLPENAMTYLTSHGVLDIDHTKTFAGLMNRLDAVEDRETIVRAAKTFYRLYADIFRDIGPVAA